MSDALATPCASTNKLSLRERRQQYEAWLKGAGVKPAQVQHITTRVDDVQATKPHTRPEVGTINELPEGAIIRTDEGGGDPDASDGVRLDLAKALLPKIEGASPELAVILANAGNAILGPMVRADDAKDDADVKNKVLEKTGAELGPPKSPGARKDEESEQEEKTRKAADDTPLSAILDALSGISKRLDAIQKKERDDDDSGSEDVPDRKQGQEGKPKGSDSEDHPLAKLQRVNMKIALRKDQEGKARFDSTTDHLFFPVQARADRVYAMNGGQAPRPMMGEGRDDYRRRLLMPLQIHSKVFRHANLQVAQHDPISFDAIENDIYKSAEDGAKDPTTVAVGQLRELVQTRGGHTYTKFVGRPISWMAAFMPQGRRVRKIIQRGDSGHETVLFQR